MKHANLLVEALIENEDPRETAYAKLKELQGQRADLQAEQSYNAAFSMALHRAGVQKENVEALDVRDGMLVGVWLRQGDYGAKLARIKKAKEAQSSRLDAKLAARDITYWDRYNSVPKRVAPREVSVSYAPIDPPVRVPSHLRP